VSNPPANEAPNASHCPHISLCALFIWAKSISKFDFTCSRNQAEYSIVSIDRRSNIELLGYLPVKGYTGLAEVKFKGSLADSIGNFFSKQSTTGRKSGVLILENFFPNGGSNPTKLMLSMRF
jgi:hypothetical protein